MTYHIRRATVIGSGTMGGAIAAHLANIGIPVDLLDIAPRELTEKEAAKGLTLDHPAVRNRIVTAGWQAVVKSRPAALYSKANTDLVRLGNLEDNFDRIADADWIVEAIIENLAIKQDLMQRLEAVRKPQTIIATNTSGLPLHLIAEGRSDEFCQHFIGTHFFNPPRYMKLLEIIPHPQTSEEVLDFFQRFGEDELGKGVVICKDTPNFIGNRIFSQAGAFELGYAIEHGYTVEEVDNIVGPLIGRPKTGIFRLLDLVGLDVMAHVNRNLYDAIEGDESRDLLNNPAVSGIMEQMIEKNWIGNKAGAGFYKKVNVKGKREFWTLDLKTMEHTPSEKVRFASIGANRKNPDTGSRITAMVGADDRAADFVRNAVYNMLTYSARRIPEITDEIVNIDRAVRWGFAHEMGPFEIWDVLGVADTVEAMEGAGFPVADWVKEMVAGGNENFYQIEDGLPVGYYSPSEGGYVGLVASKREVKVHVLKTRQERVAGNDDASLIDMGDGIGLFELHTKANTFTPDVIEMGHEVIRRLEADEFDGLVIGNDGGMFSAGANLDVQRMQQVASETGQTPAEVFSGTIKSGQDMMMGFRYCSKPVIAAPFDRTLGGGAEITMAADRIVAHAELYMGLVEVGVGLIPGWGGCKEMLRRVVNPVMRVPNADVLPAMTKIFQQVGMAQVATSAEEAREAGFLTDHDRIITNRDQLLYEAKREALYLVENGYRPPKREKIYAAGRDTLSAIRTQVYMLQDAGYASEYDAFIANKLGWILCGGDITAPAWVDEQVILDLEREVITELVQNPKTVERIMHIMTTGKPLRN